jgi:hypothetical protein
MLTKNSDVKPAELEQVAILIDAVGRELVLLADVPISKQTQFLTQIRPALSRWIWDVVFQSKAGSPERLLYQILGSAEVLHDQLSEIVANSNLGQSSLWLNVGIRLQDALAETALPNTADKLGVHEVHFVVRHLISALERAIEQGRTSPKGALTGLNNYPGLGSLVFGLARSAHLSGGNFTAHRKVEKKGTLVKALDTMRHCLETGRIEYGQLLAEALPRPGAHPVATYERLLRDARA